MQRGQILITVCLVDPTDCAVELATSESAAGRVVKLGRAGEEGSRGQDERLAVRDFGRGGMQLPCNLETYETVRHGPQEERDALRVTARQGSRFESRADT